MIVDLVSPKGKVKKCKIGVSWMFLFFGPFVMLFRGDWFSLFTLAIVNYFVGNIHMAAPYLVAVFVMLTYNNYYIKKLIKAGWSPTNEEGRKILITNDLKCHNSKE